MKDTAAKIAFNPDAPAAERFDANAEMQKAAMPTASDLIPRNQVLELAQWAAEQYDRQEFEKSLSKPNVIPFPSKAVQDKADGMQSVYLDDTRVNMLGDWYEKPTNFGFGTMRAMVDQTPVLSAVIMTRIRQVQRFARVSESGKGPGFEIRLKDTEQKIGPEEKRSIMLLQDFFTNSGFEKNPRQRRRLKRDDFSSFLAKLTRDSLVMDSMPIETEYKRNKALGLDGMYAVDGATIRLCTEHGYEGDDEIFALQVVDGQVRTAYTYDDLIYEPRNPRTDVLYGGYGMSETELLIKTVTGFLNAFTYNTKYFDSNAIPKGVLQVVGEYTQPDIEAFKRYWQAAVRGVNNAWAMPMLFSKDAMAKTTFEKFGGDVDEMMFSKWMSFLTSIICAIYGISPDEINFESFSSQGGGMRGNDTEEKLASSKDKGLRPLLSYFENIFSEFIVADFGDKYSFRFTGLDDDDPEQRLKEDTLSLTLNEFRANRGYEKAKGAWGEAPLNTSLVGVWQAEQQQENQDFGTPGQPGQPGGPGSGGAPGAGGASQKKDFGNPGDAPAGADGGGAASPAGGDPGPDPDEDEDNGDDMTKSFGLPVFVIE